MLTFPDISPIALQLGPLVIRWYSLAYIAGLIGGLFYCKRLLKFSDIEFRQGIFDDLLSYLIAGIIIGGRLGFVLFYHPQEYFSEPLEILKVWKGGMSFHGGLLGVIFAVYLFCRNNGIKFFSMMDIIACAAPIGLFFGRMANFVNAELYGRITDVSWGMVFPYGDGLPRHPSQLYEAFGEGIILFIIMYIAVHKFHTIKRYSVTSGIFLIGYGFIRSICEFFREPDAHIGLISGGVTYGQILCLPMILLGIYLIFMKGRRSVI